MRWEACCAWVSRDAKDSPGTNGRKRIISESGLQGTTSIIDHILELPRSNPTTQPPPPPLSSGTQQKILGFLSRNVFILQRIVYLRPSSPLPLPPYGGSIEQTDPSI